MAALMSCTRPCVFCCILRKEAGPSPSHLGIILFTGAWEVTWEGHGTWEHGTCDMGHGKDAAVELHFQTPHPSPKEHVTIMCLCVCVCGCSASVQMGL